MSVSLRNLVCVVVAIALAWLVFGNARSIGQVGDGQRPTQWEYRVEESHMSLPLLQRCGTEGWELVTTNQTAQDTAIIYTFVFKRPR
jgi:hypothetical protein